MIEDVNPQPEKKKNATILIVAAVAIALCCCLAIIGVGAYMTLAHAVQSVNEQIQEGIGYSGQADELLRSDVLKAISAYEQSQTGCAEVTLLGGQMIISAEQSTDGSWMETWQILACGESHLYSISFTPSPGGGTDFSASRIDG